MGIFDRFNKTVISDKNKLTIVNKDKFVIDFEGLPVINKVLSDGVITLDSHEKLAVFIYESDKGVIFMYDDNPSYKSNVDNALLITLSLNKEITKLRSSCDFIGDLYNKYSTLIDIDKGFVGKLDEYIQNIFADAIELKASDIHINAEDSKPTKIRFRVDGDLFPYKIFPEEQTDSLFNTLFNNYLSNGEKNGTFLRNSIIDSKIERSFELVSNRVGNNKYSLRFSSANRTNNGCSIVLRLLDAEIGNHVGSLEGLGFNKYVCDALMPILHSSIGGIYIVGPTGSGKSLTLKTMLDLIGDYHEGRKNLITVEDPPEYKMKHASQQPVMHKTKDSPKQRKYNYIKALRSVVRQDPDVVMVGEIRDDESAEMALKTTITGHLMLTTTHVTDTSKFFPRMINEFKLPSNSLSMDEMVKAVLSQRLVKVLCTKCCLSFNEVSQNINKKHYLAISSLFKDSISSLRFHNKDGCSECNNTGIIGRTAVCELLIPDSQYLTHIQNENFRAASEYWYSNIGDGFTGVSYVDDAINKAKLGFVDIIYINDNIKPILDNFFTKNKFTLLEENNGL